MDLRAAELELGSYGGAIGLPRDGLSHKSPEKLPTTKGTPGQAGDSFYPFLGTPLALSHIPHI